MSCVEASRNAHPMTHQMTHQMTILARIDKEIESIKQEIDRVSDTVKKDIYELLSVSMEDITDEQKKMFEKRHFKSLRDQKEKSLQKALSKLESLKDAFLFECSECER